MPIITPEIDGDALAEKGSPALRAEPWWERIPTLAMYAALATAVIAWLRPITAPLWLDEAGSFWETAGGFREIASRQPAEFPTYAYILCLARSVLGSSEAALRIPSVLAMLGAVALLYLIAREFFERNVALAVCVVFSVHPIVVFAAIDARPYAFGALVANVAIYSFLLWIRTQRTRYAVTWGAASAGILYFHFLFGVILPAFVLLLVISRPQPWKEFWSQLVKAAVTFALLLFPVLRPFLLMAHTSKTHVADAAPTVMDLVKTIAPGTIVPVVGLALLAAVVFRQFHHRNDRGWSSAVRCAVLGLVPLLALFTISSVTALHVFTPRYRLEAITGIALGWGWLLGWVDSRLLRAAICMALVIPLARTQFDVPVHGHSWKQAVEIVNDETAADHAPVLVCSELAEANFTPMPDDISTSPLFSTLTYYPLRSRVVPLPRSLTPTAEREVARFLTDAVPRKQRFLALGRGNSIDILRSIGKATGSSYTAKELAAPDGVVVMEFRPR